MVSASGRFAGSIMPRRCAPSSGPRVKGYRGHSDTEVLLEAFAEWGLERTLSEAVGMFAIALWDRQARELCLIRDRLGKKPLYWSLLDGLLLFGSELRAQLGPIRGSRPRSTATRSWGSCAGANSSPGATWASAATAARRCSPTGRCARPSAVHGRRRSAAAWRFAIPVGSWLRGPLRDWVEDLLDEGHLRAGGLFNPAPIRARWEEHLAGRRNWQGALWSVLMFQAWQRVHAR